MGKSRNPNTYSDVAAVLDAVLARGGEGKYRLSRRGEAIRWRQRAYQLRLILRDLAEKTCVPGQAPSTKYDHLVLLHDESDPTLVTITTRRPVGVLEVGGEVVTPGPTRDVQRPALQDDMESLLDDLS